MAPRINCYFVERSGICLSCFVATPAIFQRAVHFLLASGARRGMVSLPHAFLTMKFLFLTTALALVLSSCETTNSNSTASNVVSPTPTKPAVEKKETASTGVKPYTRSTCIVTGEKLDSKGMVITEVYKGHEFKMCCEACHIAFKMDKEFYLAKL